MIDPSATSVAKKDVMTDYIVTLLLIVDLLLLGLVMGFSKSALIGGAAVIAGSSVGAIAGLLFGIPRRTAAVAKDAGGSAPGVARHVAISANTSLEEVSDWLTKTIVGVGLVSWASLLKNLDNAGGRLGIALFGVGARALPGGVAIILSSFSLGMLAAYLWFSRYLPSEFDEAFRGVNRDDPHGLSQQSSSVAPPSPTLTLSLDGASAVEASADTGDSESLAVPSAEQQLQEAVKLKYAQMRRAPQRVDDWAKGMFGGRADVTNSFGHRVLSATVGRSKDGYYTVELTVTADPRPVTEAVFFLHNTFQNTTPAVSFDSRGMAVLELKAIGAFTVGVLTDDGTTELELDLSELRGAPKAFREAD